MENKLYSLCNDLIVILNSLKQDNKISDQELELHLKDKISYLQIHDKFYTSEKTRDKYLLYGLDTREIDTSYFLGYNR